MKRLHTPLFSVVIPTYNRPRMVLRALRSVQQQTCTDWEVLLINDGSTTDYSLVEKHVQEDNRISYLLQEHRGRGAVRNLGLRRATGTFLTFLDDDDWWEPVHLALLKRHIQQYPQKAVFIQWGCRWDRGRGSKTILLPASSHQDLLRHLWQHGWQLGMIAVDRRLGGNRSFNPDYLFAQDLDFLLRLLLEIPSQVVRQTTLHVSDHSTRGTYQVDRSNYRRFYYAHVASRQRLAYDFDTQLQTLFSARERNKMQALRYVYVAHWIMRVPKIRFALGLLGKAVRCYPPVVFFVAFAKSLLSWAHLWPFGAVRSGSNAKSTPSGKAEDS